MLALLFRPALRDNLTWQWRASSPRRTVFSQEQACTAAMAGPRPGTHGEPAAWQPCSQTLPVAAGKRYSFFLYKRGQVGMGITRFWSHGRASKFALGLSLPLGFFPYQCYWTFFCVLVSSFTKWTDYLAFTLEGILRNNEVLWVLLSHTDTHTTGEERTEID